MRGTFLVGVLLLALVSPASAASLSRDTLVAWNEYVRRTEARIEGELDDGERFLALECRLREERLAIERRLRGGEIVTEKLETLREDGASIAIPKGMVHHWRGSVFVPGVDVDALVAWLSDYDRHASYFDEVESSRLVARRGDAFDIFLRLRREKIVTVHYNTEHRVVYVRHGEGRVSSTSVSTRIAELDRAGTSEEVEKPPGEDRGFLWRVSSYWRFQQVSGGVVVECESLSLSRSVPAMVRFFVSGYLDSVPRESLEATLGPIRTRSLRMLEGGSGPGAPGARLGR